MTSRTISNSDDVIDSRDVIARIEELEAEREPLAEAVTEAATADDAAQNAAPDADYDLAKTLDEKRAALKEWDDENDEELKALKALADEGEGWADDWKYGATLIRESYFVEYCQEMVEDIGDMPNGFPSYLEIDWNKTADNLRVDYTEVEYDGVTYLVR